MLNPNEESKFDYIMSLIKTDTKLPKQIVLKNVQPGESPMMSKRRNPCALRFHKVKFDKDPLRFMLHEVMLYYPLRWEVDLDNVQALYEETFQGKSKIDIIKSQVMEFLESVTEARYFVEEAKKELDLEGITDELDAQGQQDNEGCNDEELEVHPEYSSCHPGKIFFCFDYGANVLSLYITCALWHDLKNWVFNAHEM